MRNGEEFEPVLNPVYEYFEQPKPVYEYYEQPFLDEPHFEPAPVAQVENPIVQLSPEIETTADENLLFGYPQEYAIAGGFIVLIAVLWITKK